MAPALLLSKGHWCILVAWWPMLRPKLRWWLLWCCCAACAWLWLLLELLLLFCCVACRCEFFLFFMRRFWNHILTCIDTLTKCVVSLAFSNSIASLPFTHLTLCQLQVACQFPALLFGHIRIEEELLLQLQCLELGVWLALFPHRHLAGPLVHRCRCHGTHGADRKSARSAWEWGKERNINKVWILLFKM